MSISRPIVSNSAQPLSLEESKRRSLVASLITRLRAGETLTQELNQLGLYRMETPDAVIWYNKPRPRYVTEFVDLLLAIKNQRYEGEAYFIEDRGLQSKFTGVLLHIAEDLVRGQIAKDLELGRDATAAKLYLSDFLLIKQNLLGTDSEKPTLSQTEKQEQVPSTSSPALVDVKPQTAPTPKLRNLSPECMSLLLQTKKEFQKKKATLENVNLVMILAHYLQITSWLKNAILMYPMDTEEDVIEEYGDRVANFSGIIKKSDYKALLLALDQGLAEIIADSKIRGEKCFLELSCLCRSLVSSLMDDPNCAKDCIKYFQAAVLVEPSEHILVTDNAHKLRCEALKCYSRVANYFSEVEGAAFNQATNKEAALFKVETYIKLAKADKDKRNFFAAFINYAIAEWLVRSDLDTDPSLPMLSIKHKKSKMRQQLEAAAAAEKNQSTVKAEGSKVTAVSKAQVKPVVSSVMEKRAADMARELELDEKKAELKVLKKEKRKTANKAKLAAKKEENRRLAAEAEALRKVEEVEAARIAAEKAEANRKLVEAEKARIETEKAEARRAAILDQLALMAAEKAEKERIAAEAEKARAAAEKAEAERIAVEAEKARVAAEQAEKERIAAEAEKARRAVEIESVREMTTGLIRRIVGEAIKLSSENAQEKMKLLAQQEALRQQQRKERESLPLQDFKPEALYPALSVQIIALLKKLSVEVEQAAREAGSKGTQLEIYGSFVLYYAMLSLGKEKTRQPQDLDLLIDMKGLIYHRGRDFISRLMKLGFTVKESNPYKAYVKLELPLQSSVSATANQSGLYDLSITVAFNGYKSINLLHLTRHRLRFNPQQGLISFDGGNEGQKKELYEDIVQGVGKADLEDIMRPTLDLVNFFSRLLKFYYEYKDLFKMDEETTLKILTDWKWSKNYFRNRLGKNCRAFHVDPELAKDNSYLEMADLIARNYFSGREAQAIIMGFVAALVEVLSVEAAFQPLSEDQLAEVALRVTAGLQARYNSSGYQSAGKKKAEIIADFHAVLVRNLNEVLRINVIEYADTVLALPLMVKNFYQKMKEKQLREENERLLNLQAANALSRASSQPAFSSTQRAVVAPMTPNVTTAGPSLEEQVNRTFSQLEMAAARVNNWQQAQAQAVVTQAAMLPSYHNLGLPHLWNVQMNKSLSYSTNSRKINSGKEEDFSTVRLPQGDPKF